jgi:hypothetical protein
MLPIRTSSAAVAGPPVVRSATPDVPDQDPERPVTATTAAACWLLGSPPIASASAWALSGGSGDAAAAAAPAAPGTAMTASAAVAKATAVTASHRAARNPHARSQPPNLTALPP